MQVPVDPESLAAIADETGGQAYEAATQGQLADVYASIGSSIGYDTVDSDITEWFVAGAMLGFSCRPGSPWPGRTASRRSALPADRDPAPASLPGSASRPPAAERRR